MAVRHERIFVKPPTDLVLANYGIKGLSPDYAIFSTFISQGPLNFTLTETIQKVFRG